MCYPLRHAAVITVRNTGLFICAIWAASLLGCFIRFTLIYFSELGSRQKGEFCTGLSLLVGPLSEDFDAASTYLAFVSAGGAVAFSYIGVTVAAKSASTDKGSSQKARNTLLLHLVQLAFSLSSTLHSPILTSLSTTVTRIVFVRVQNVLYVFPFVLPRGLSALIYGIRDRSIRHVLLYRLCCQL